MTRPLIVSIVLTTSILSISGCATANPGIAGRSPANVNLRMQEYEALRSKIEAIHSASLFTETSPRLFNSKMIENYGAGLEHNYCTAQMSPDDCARRINQVVFSTLEDRYYAADPVAVQQTCMNEPLICDDLNALETLYRHLHNASVVQSEHEKLALVDQWREGKLSDDELKAALHFDFQFDSGKLVVSQPQA